MRTFLLNILLSMQVSGFNVCNCGNCGGIILFNKETKPTTESETENVICPYYKKEMAYSDCPDLYYEGMPELN